ncbi:MAG: iron-containing alcohol dehydrogenase [Chloroflexota bacterium]
MGHDGRGWTGATNARPAREVELRYGHGLVEQESSKWPRYLAVTTPTAWETAKGFLGQEPAGVGTVRYLDWDHLDEVTSALPGDAGLVVGVGGGTALDASKYVALKKDLPLILVPSAVSTGAIIHGMLAKWDGHKIIGSVKEWPYCDCEHVLVDYELVLNSPWYLNTAGLGDVLCMYSGVSEWRYNAANGAAPPVDEPLVRPSLEYYDYLADNFPATLGPDGSLTAESVRFIMTAVHERDDRQLRHPHAPGGGHGLANLSLEVIERTLIHGEVAALGSAIICWHTGEHDWLLDRLERCRVRVNPSVIGFEKDELRLLLERVPDLYREKGVRSVLVDEPIVGNRFEELWSFLTSVQ